MRIITVLLLSFLVYSCESDKEMSFTSVTITKVFEDSLSIRAIAPISTSQVWFAANNGRVGLIDGAIPKLTTIRYSDSLLSFRAIATTKDAVFVLSIANPGVLYKISVDGTEATTMEEVYVEEGEKVFYDAIAFWNDTEGIAMGDPTEDCLSIIITRDGGDSWEKTPCSDLPKTVASEAGFAASNTNISIVNNNVWIASGGERSRVFHSADKGVTWAVYNTPMLQGKAMTGIYSISFFDEKIGVIFGGNWEEKEFNEGNKAISHDGGKTWKLMSNGAGPGYRSCVAFVPGTEGEGLVAVGSPGISYSPDQGDSWTELSDEGFYAIAFVNDSIAFASGRNKISKLLFK